MGFFSAWVFRQSSIYILLTLEVTRDYDVPLPGGNLRIQWRLGMIGLGQKDSIIHGNGMCNIQVSV